MSPQRSPNEEAEYQLMLFRRKLNQELLGEQCRCGSKKRRTSTFCKPCYLSLPEEVRSGLKKRLGEGYEDAYQMACRMLNRETTAGAAG